MSYLLTEIAMEMLGWQFYDIDGIPRPINLEGLNNAKCEQSESLEQVLNMIFLDKKISVKAEADSSSNAEHVQIEMQQLPTQEELQEVEMVFEGNESESVQNAKNPLSLSPNSLEEVSPTKESSDELSSDAQPNHDNIIFDNITNFGISRPFQLRLRNDLKEDADIKINQNITQPTFKIQSVVGGFCLNKDNSTSSAIQSVMLPATTTISNLCPIQTFQLYNEQMVPNKFTTPISSDVNSAGASNRSLLKGSYIQNLPSSDCGSRFIDLTDDGLCHQDLQRKIENEMVNITHDLLRQKAQYYKSLPESIKTKQLASRKACQAYCQQELRNLEKELQNFEELRTKAEQMSVVKFPRTFPKYVHISNALSSAKLSRAGIKKEENDVKANLQLAMRKRSL